MDGRTGGILVTDYESNAAGEWNVTTKWTPNGRPGIDDTVNIKHKITITDTIEYIRRIIIENNGGELEINATSQDTGLIMQNATLSRLEIQQSLTTPGVLDMNGTEDYTAYIRQQNATPTLDSAFLLYGIVTMDYAEISGFWFGEDVPSVYKIRCHDMELTMDNSFIQAHHTHPFYFWGDPASVSMTHSEFRNMYHALYYSDSVFFVFTEHPRNIGKSIGVISVEQTPIGKVGGIVHVLSTTKKKVVLKGSFGEYDNRFKLEDLEGFVNNLDNWIYFAPDNIYLVMKLLGFNIKEPPGNPYLTHYTLNMSEAD